jgi:hypothetical protein
LLSRVLFVFLLCLPRTALGVDRFALLIGNNVGGDQDATLEFAEQDAVRLSEVLTELGGFPRENVVLLRGSGSEEARRALIALNERIRTSSAPGGEAMLLVFYSGHADAARLHLGESEIELHELEQLVRGSAAAYRMLILDACRSGALTRVKGGTSVPPFAIEAEGSLTAEGVVFLTSTSANEDAQESDALGGSFFTHYLVSGLLGAADENQDGRIGLREAYEYAYQHTLRASSRTAIGPQHPTFNWEVRGHGDVTLTRLGDRRRGELLVPAGRAFMVLADSEGPVVAEIAQAKSARRISLEPGRYFVRSRASDHLLEGRVVLRAGERIDLAEVELARTDYARLVRKGGGKELAHGPQVSLQTRTPLSGLGTYCAGAEVGWVFDFSALSFAPHLVGCRGIGSEARLGRTDELGGGLRIAHAFDLPVVTIELAASGGASALHQESGRTAAAGWLAAEAQLSFDAGAGFSIGAFGAVMLYLVQLERTEGIGLSPLVAGRFGVVAGKRF